MHSKITNLMRKSEPFEHILKENSELIESSLLVAYLTYSHEKYGLVETLVDKHAKGKPYEMKPNFAKLRYENNDLTKNLFPTKESYDFTLNDPAISTSMRSNLAAAFFVLEIMAPAERNIKNYRMRIMQRIASTVKKWGIPKHNDKYQYSYEEMYDKPYYLVSWVASSLELVFSINSSEQYDIVSELVEHSFYNRESLAKIVSTPMSQLVATIDVDGAFVTTDENELMWSEKKVKALVAPSVEEEFHEAISKMREIGLRKIPNMYEKWFQTKDLDSFPIIAQIYSYSFHVGYRKQKMEDAVLEQITTQYSDDVNEDMYFEYASRISSLLYEMLNKYVINSDVILLQSEISALLSMSSASNGKQISFKTKTKKFVTTKKNLHVMHDMQKGLYSVDPVPKVDATNPIPLGRRDVPGRRTRTIFILPYQHFMAQHAVVELMLKEAKHMATFSEFYSGPSQLISFGDTNRFIADNVILLYTDVSQWDASQHNTAIFRDAIINGLSKLMTLTESSTIKDTLRRYIDSQKLMKDSHVILGDKIYQYGAVASGEKQTKLANSVANLALIQTVLNRLGSLYDFTVKLVRVDGDDNYAALSFDKKVDAQFMQQVSDSIKELYKAMNISVKALVSNVGIEMAKRYIAGGRMFFRAGINILTTEKRGSAERWDQAAIMYSSYNVNRHRGFVTDKRFVYTKTVQMTSLKITGSVRLFPASSTLMINSPYKVLDADDDVPTMWYTTDELAYQKLLVSMPTAKSNLAEEISSTSTFRNYVRKLVDAIAASDTTTEKRVRMSITRTEKTKLSSIPLVAIEKRRKQITNMTLAIQRPFNVTSSVYTISDASSYILSRTTFEEVEVESFKPIFYDPIPMLPTELKLCLRKFGPRLSVDQHASQRSEIAKLISKYTVYKPSVNELFEVLVQSPTEIMAYLMSLNIPMADASAYSGSSKPTTDKYLVTTDYVSTLISINYSGLNYINLESPIFSELIYKFEMSDTNEVSYVATLVMKVEIIKRYIREQKTYRASVSMKKAERLQFWRMLKKLSPISSPFSSTLYED
uniref:RNA-directed RNA polymerase n=1 Tax=Wenling jack mackerels rotavirus TaxID=2116448 RepID=A0A2P1GNA4_9REOV|nr:RNA-dependent RNA polymerase [Wenling jack mackerels rotavirus]